jgi:hypothetical protein
VCTYTTERVTVSGSGRGQLGWVELTEATVYFDHPQHTPAEHTLNLDFLSSSAGPGARVALELTVDSARALAQALDTVLASVSG